MYNGTEIWFQLSQKLSGGNAVLIDTGFPGQLGHIREKLKSAGLPLEKLTKIILTHSDMDHIGNLRNIITALPHPAEVITHTNEKPYIEGKLLPIKASQMESA